ncbi:MSCRAMM family protein [Halorubrum sp. DTA98]|uniref:MSCRAMM family protein n=1 Tax=Halorubrum sp. DTA98 TaxID=3402163 RepID=UPI003AAC68AA
MPSLRIYDTKGNEYSPSGGTGRTNERIKEQFYAGVRFAVESVGETRITAFFRARETRDARSEQFYAEYTVHGTSNPIDEFDDALRRRVESEWGYTIDDTSEEMSVFRAVTRNDATVPGSDQDRRVLREMVGSGSLANVGVRDASTAVGLIREMADACSRVAITDSANTDSLSEFDLAIVTGGHAGIEPLGGTESRWERTEQSLRTQFIDEEIGRIEDAVQALSRDHGLSSSEIRNRVTRRVPALKGSSGGSSSIGSVSGPTSRKQKLLSAEVGKYVAIAAVALLVLIGGVFGAGMLGFGPFAAGGDTIQGTVYDGDVDGDDAGGVANATVELLDERGSVDEETTDEGGNFTFNDLDDGNYTLRVETSEHEYEQMDDVSPGGEPVEFTPVSSDDAVSGEVVDAETREPVEDASVTLYDDDDAEIDSATGGEFTFEVDDPDATYTVRASADGYEEGTVEATVEEPMTIELAEGHTVLSGEVRNGSDGETVEGATVTAENDAGETETVETNDDGRYELELARGEYEVTADAGGFAEQSESVTLDGDAVTQDFELDAQASWSGVVRDADDDSEITGASVELFVDDEKVDEKSDIASASFEFEGLDPVAHTVEVEVNSWENETLTREFEPGETREADIRLESE